MWKEILGIYYRNECCGLANKYFKTTIPRHLKITDEEEIRKHLLDNYASIRFLCQQYSKLGMEKICKGCLLMWKEQEREFEPLKRECYSCKKIKELTKIQKIPSKGWKWLCQNCNFITL